MTTDDSLIEFSVYKRDITQSIYKYEFVQFVYASSWKEASKEYPIEQGFKVLHESPSLLTRYRPLSYADFPQATKNRLASLFSEIITNDKPRS